MYKVGAGTDYTIRFQEQIYAARYDLCKQISHLVQIIGGTGETSSKSPCLCCPQLQTSRSIPHTALTIISNQYLHRHVRPHLPTIRDKPIAHAPLVYRKLIAGDPSSAAQRAATVSISNGEGRKSCRFSVIFRRKSMQVSPKCVQLQQTM